MKNIEEAIKFIELELKQIEQDYKKGFITGRIIRSSEKFKLLQDAWLNLKKLTI